MIIKHPHSFLVNTPPTPRTPKSIVVVFGWWGATNRQLLKYSQLYEEEGCQTIQIIINKYSILSADTTAVDVCARQTIAMVADVLQRHQNQGNKIPVFLHACSNGGALIVERMEHLIRQEQHQATTEPKNNEIRLVQDHLVGEMFDSSPAHFSQEGALKALAGAFKSGVVKFVVSQLTPLVSLLLRLLCKLRGADSYMQLYWDNMCHSAVCTKQGFIYSSADAITDVDKLEELIAARRKKNELTTVLRFEDSTHVSHLRKHPDAYKSFVVKFLDQAISTCDRNESSSVKSQ